MSNWVERGPRLETSRCAENQQRVRRGQVGREVGAGLCVNPTVWPATDLTDVSPVPDGQHVYPQIGCADAIEMVARSLRCRYLTASRNGKIMLGPWRLRVRRNLVERPGQREEFSALVCCDRGDRVETAALQNVGFARRVT